MRSNENMSPFQLVKSLTPSQPAFEPPFPDRAIKAQIRAGGKTELQTPSSLVDED